MMYSWAIKIKLFLKLNPGKCLVNELHGYHKYQFVSFRFIYKTHLTEINYGPTGMFPFIFLISKYLKK